MMIVQLNGAELDAYNEFIGHFEQKKITDRETICKCPACGHDKLYISVGDRNGVRNILLNCFHNCEYKDILQSAGLEPKDLYLTKLQKKPYKEQCADVRNHVYTDKDGNPLFRKRIYKFFMYWDSGKDKKKYPGEKDAEWQIYDPEAKEFVYNKNHIACNTLYHFDKLTGDTVYIPEGEKDVETLESMELIATSSPHGAGTSWGGKRNFLPQLEGIKNAYILADNDEVGEKYAYGVAQYLTKGGISCKIIKAKDIYPEAEEKWDISDIVSKIGKAAAKEALQNAVNAAEIYQLSTEDVPKEQLQRMQNPYNADGNGRLSIENLKAAMEQLDIKVKHNIINHQIEYSGKFIDNMDPVGVNATIPHLLYNKLQYFLKGCTAEKISSFLNSIAFEKSSEYNPILEAISSTKWDNKDHISEMFELMHIPVEDKLSRTLMTKWLMQCYCGLYNKIEDPFSLDLTLVFVGEQGYGKTRLFEKLALSRKYFGEGITLDPRDKDSRMQVASYWITELGEIGSTMKKEINALKAFISNPTDTNRPPYGKAAVTHPRLTSFCGTTNDREFLVDDTGNRRYAVVELPKDKFIDIKSEEFKNFNPLQLWAQIADIVHEELRAGETYASAFRLSRSELSELEERNKDYSKPMTAEREVEDLLASIYSSRDWYYTAYTATEFKEKYSELSKYSTVQIGKCLAKLGYECTRQKVKGTVRRVYKLPCERTSSTNYFDNDYYQANSGEQKRRAGVELL